MNFTLKPPFRDWTFDSSVGSQKFICQIDSGSNLTLIGFDIVHLLKQHKQISLGSRCVPFGTSSEGLAFAIKIHSVEIPLGGEVVKANTIFVPFVNHHNQDSVSWILQETCLIGTDILNNYNISVKFEDGNNNTVSAANLNLTPHSFVYELEEFEDYSIKEALEIMNSKQAPIDTGYSSKLSSLEEITPSTRFKKR